ncbi:hypothetical protein [Streptomyces sp. NPDC058463]|uniref:hypothetical protein n=1 Tax=Streptomyces sp. NPDC058463 TaxID=3346510 RepID=UPI00364CA2AE
MSVLVAVIPAAVVPGVTPALTVRLLQQHVIGLLEAMATRDTAVLCGSQAQAIAPASSVAPDSVPSAYTTVKR